MLHYQHLLSNDDMSQPAYLMTTAEVEEAASVEAVEVAVDVVIQKPYDLEKHMMMVKAPEQEADMISGWAREWGSTDGIVVAARPSPGDSNDLLRIAGYL